MENVCMQNKKVNDVVDQKAYAAPTMQVFALKHEVNLLQDSCGGDPTTCNGCPMQ